MRDVRTWVEIDAAALRHNVAEFRKLIRLRASSAEAVASAAKAERGYGGHVGPKRQLMAVVKSNAYGHGLVPVAKLLARGNPKPETRNPKSLWFGVDSIVEGLALRRAGIRNPILVLGYTLPSRLTEAARKRITLTVSHFEALEAMARAEKRPAFHLKLDTGMHRQGFQEYEMPKLIAALKQYRLMPDGAYSHYAFPEHSRDSRLQRDCFDRCIRLLAAAGIRPIELHMSATGGVWERRDSYPMVRIGFGLYGYLRRPVRKNPLRPVLTWKTVVSEVKRVTKGERIGYDFTERFTRDSTIAILPIGYWHGFDRGLSSIGEVLVRGQRAKVMGRVSMDITAVDVTGIRGVRIGDEAVLIGRQGRPFDPSTPLRAGVAQGREFIGADEIAEKLGTSPYEVLTRINPLIRREIKK